jgi:osmotically inducible protein OsmC
MALANGLAQAGHPPTRLETGAVATLDQADGGFRITSMRLSVRGQVDGIDDEAFRVAAEEARQGCPVSNALDDGIEITLETTLA